MQYNFYKNPGQVEDSMLRKILFCLQRQKITDASPREDMIDSLPIGIQSRS